MDDLIKLLQNLMANKPRPKGGIADTPQGVEFLGTKLTKKQLQEYELINTKITDNATTTPNPVIIAIFALSIVLYN